MIQLMPNTTDIGAKFPTLVYQALWIREMNPDLFQEKDGAKA